MGLPADLAQLFHELLAQGHDLDLRQGVIVKHRKFVTTDSSQDCCIQEGRAHGLGVQSIAAFCRKNGAVCEFDLTDGWFRLRLVL